MDKNARYFKPISLLIASMILVGIVLSAFVAPVSAETEEPPVVEFELPDENITIQDVFLWDDTFGWAVGTKGEAENTQPVIVLTEDGGASWVEVGSGIKTGVLVTVNFTDRMTGYAAGQDWGGEVPTLILRTQDGGQTWEKATLPQVFGSVDKVYFSETGLGWSVGFDFGNFHSLLLRSEDGITWVEQDHPSHEEAGLFGITFPSEEVGYAVGSYGWENPTPYLIKTTDGGTTWTELEPPMPQAMLSDVLFLDELYGIVIGTSGDLGVILVTEDGGSRWEISEFSGSTVYMRKMLIYEAMILVFANICDKDYVCKALILGSKDKGKLWEEVMRLNAKVSAVNQGSTDADKILAAYKDINTILKNAHWSYYYDTAP